MEKIGRYPIIRMLGSGGMSNVYLAEDLLLNRKVAIKILNPEFVSDNNKLARFEKEAKAASTLEHPGVAHIYEIGEADGNHFIAMQYIEGETLAEKIERSPVPFSKIIDWAIQICEAVAEAHAHGIIHRDLKPHNIMVTANGQTKVLDFGIAKIVEEKYQSDPASNTGFITETGVIIGTIQYMSPEQALAKKIDHRSDIFSLGIVLYELSTGRLPFYGVNQVETMQKILQDQPAPFTRTSPGIPFEFERIVLKCLEKEPERRYQSVSDLLVDLSNLKRDTAAERITTSLTIAPPKPRRWWVAMILLIILSVAAIYFLEHRTRNIHSLAVLPFINESSEPGMEVVTDGITDEIINKLSQIPNLKVLSRATVFSYKGKQMDPRKVVHDLDVDAIITGNLTKFGDNLRVQVSLVEREGTQVWGEMYSCRTSELQTIQTEISRDISDKLPHKLSGQVRKQITKEHTMDPRAYQLFLEGRFHLNKRSRENFQFAIENFNEAIARDPNYAQAYAGLADTYILLCNWGFLLPEHGFPKAKEAAEKALSLDPSLAEAHTSLAFILSNYEWKWKEAELRYQTAISLNPNYSIAHQWYALYLTILGRFDEALREIRTAQQLDPLSLIINANVGYTLYFDRRYDEAIAELQKTMDLDPDFALTYQILGYAYGQKGDYEQSINSFEKAIDLAPDNLTFEADQAWAYAKSGKRDLAKALVERQIRISTNTYVAPFHIAGAYVGLNQKQEALEWLEKAYQERSDQVTYIAKDPRFDSIRNEPEFQELLRKIGL
jgi:serine/threonine protein kinase/tetratricopeptide (TPR) repeat protein